ncbi:MAG: hypothetical protein HRU19_20295 [Pseudobacteriovorax sp.]|nr:hypothetical protein [Pseudobacteriovorax sp.]
MIARSLGILTVAVLVLAVSCQTKITYYPAIDPSRATKPTIPVLEELNARKDLDFGIYFFAVDGEGQRFTPGVKNRFFDPKRPTVLYLHGWEKDTTLRDFRETFITDEQEGFIGKRIHASWKAAGWNTGIFYWNQFADELHVEDAEAKIWTYRSQKKLRYRVKDGSFRPSGLEATITEIFTAYYQELFSRSSYHPESEIRLVGHSLGQQLALLATQRLAANPKVVPPKRLALLDPFWSRGAKGYLTEESKTVALATAAIAEDIYRRYNIAIEYHRTSIIGRWYFACDFNPGLERVAASVYWNLDYLSSFDIKAGHIAAIPIYFSTYDKGINLPVGARVSHQKIREAMNLPGIWTHTKGTKTPLLEDDRFILEQ